MFQLYANFKKRIRVEKIMIWQTDEYKDKKYDEDKDDDRNNN